MGNKVHYKDITALLYVGFVISFVVFSEMMSVMDHYNNLKQQMSQRNYEYNYNMTIYDPEQSVEKNIYTVPGSCTYIDGMSTYIKNSNTQQEVRIYIGYDTMLKYNISSGSLPEYKEQKKECVAVIGCNLLDNTYKQGQKRYIELEGDKYRVVAVTGDTTQDYDSNRIILFYDCLGKRMKNLVEGQKNYRIMIRSDADLSFEVSALEEKTRQYSGVSCSVKQSFPEELGYGLITTKLPINIMIYIFCILNCALMSEFWVEKRYHEICVRKCFGYTNGQVLKRLGIDLANILMVSVGSIAILKILVQLLLYHTCHFTVNQVIWDVKVFCLYTLITIIITIVYPSIKVFSAMPVSALKEGVDH